MSRTIVGLDIGSSGIRAAEFTTGRRPPALRRFATVPLPPGAVRFGAVADVEAVAEALRALRGRGSSTPRPWLWALRMPASFRMRYADLDELAGGER